MTPIAAGGIVRRVSAFLFALIIGIWAVAVATDSVLADNKDKLSAADIIAKHLAAAGGKDTLAKVKSRVAIGTAAKDSEAGVPMAVMSEAPNRVSAMYQFRAFNWQLTYDGRKSIVRPLLSRANSPVLQKYQDMLATGTMFNGISLYNVLSQADAGDVKLEAKGIKKVKGKPAYTVEMKRGKDKALLYFDQDTFMWVRTDYGSVQLTREMGQLTNAIESKDQETTCDFYVETSDFRQVDGMTLPFKLEIVATAPLLTQKNVGTIIATISEYKHNVPIDPKMFQ
jgi:hypothetical protein